jgi:hypothetical protein
MNPTFGMARSSDNEVKFTIRDRPAPTVLTRRCVLTIWLGLFLFGWLKSRAAAGGCPKRRFYLLQQGRKARSFDATPAESCCHAEIGEAGNRRRDFAGG